ncbi:single-stranded DNA-binding protein [Glutamicibacter arilaitensis]|uniref:single-stranded DNA-binding protein n=2 Tax=Glutamicibacter TaxID=1742989 RepID=UPI003F9235D1
MRMGPKTVTGNLADNPVWQEANGNKFLTMCLLETQRVQNRETRQWEDGETTRYDVAVRDLRMAENIMQSAGKGDRLTVSGQYDLAPYVDSKGEAGMNHRIYASEVAASMKFNPVQVPERQKSVQQSPDVDQWTPHQGQNAPAQAPQQSAPAHGGNAPSQVSRSGEAQAFGARMTDHFRHQGPPPVNPSSTSGPSY